MKLPGIRRDQPGQLTKQNVNLPFLEANARASAIEAVAGTIRSDRDVLQKYHDRETLRETQAGILGVQQRLVEAEQTYGSKEEFNPLDPASADDENLSGALDKAGITNLEQAVPAYRVKPELMGTAWSNAIEEYADSIHDPEAKAKFVFDQNKARGTKYLQDTVQASKDQVVYQAKQTKQAVTQAVQNKDYGSARLAIMESELTGQEKVKEMKGVSRVEQIDSYSGVLKQRDPKAMGEALQTLLDEDSPLSSELTEPEEKTYANALRTAIKQEKTKAGATGAGLLALTKDDSRKMTTALNRGQAVDVEHSIKVLGIMEKTDPVLARNLQNAINIQPYLADTNQQSLRGMKARHSTTGTTYASGQDAYNANIVDKQIEANVTAIMTDTIGYMIDNSVQEVTPLDFGSLEGFAQGLELRKGNVITARKMYGYSSGYLSKKELTGVGDMLERITDPAKKMQMFAGVNQALGKQAGNFYEQMKNSGIGGADMIAGQLASEQDGIPDALKVVKGSVLLKSPAGKEIVTTDTKNFIKDAVVVKFGNAFAGNATQRSLMLDAVTAAYAQSSAEASDFGSTDSARLDQAIKTATGGFVEFNGATLQAPTKAMSNGGFDTWLDTIDPVAFSGMNTLQTPQEMKENINSGAWKLRGVGRGEYQVMIAGEPVGSLTNNSVPFTLKYDADAEPYYEAPTEEELATIKAGQAREKQLFSGVGIPDIGNLMSGPEDAEFKKGEPFFGRVMKDYNDQKAKRNAN